MNKSPLPTELATQLLDQIKRPDTSDDTVSWVVVRVGETRAAEMIQDLVQKHANALRDLNISDTHRMALWKTVAGLGRLDLVRPLLDAMVFDEAHACNLIDHRTLMDPDLRRAVIGYATEKDWQKKFMMIRTSVSARYALEDNAMAWGPVLADFVKSYKNSSLAATAAVDEYTKKRSKLTSTEQRQDLDGRLSTVLTICADSGLDFERMVKTSYQIKTPDHKERVTKEIHGVLHWILHNCLRDKLSEHYLAALDVLVDQGANWRGLIDTGVLDPNELALLRQVPAVRRELLAETTPTVSGRTNAPRGRM